VAWTMAFAATLFAGRPADIGASALGAGAIGQSLDPTDAEW
jgi:hypothetical protein